MIKLQGIKPAINDVCQIGPEHICAGHANTGSIVAISSDGHTASVEAGGIVDTVPVRGLVPIERPISSRLASALR